MLLGEVVAVCCLVEGVPIVGFGITLETAGRHGGCGLDS